MMHFKQMDLKSKVFVSLKKWEKNEFLPDIQQKQEGNLEQLQWLCLIQQDPQVP